MTTRDTVLEMLITRALAKLRALMTKRPELPCAAKAQRYHAGIKRTGAVHALGDRSLIAVVLRNDLGHMIFGGQHRF